MSFDTCSPLITALIRQRQVLAVQGWFGSASPLLLKDGAASSKWTWCFGHPPRRCWPCSGVLRPTGTFPTWPQAPAGGWVEREKAGLLWKQATWMGHGGGFQWTHCEKLSLIGVPVSWFPLCHSDACRVDTEASQRCSNNCLAAELQKHQYNASALAGLIRFQSFKGFMFFKIDFQFFSISTIVASMLSTKSVWNRKSISCFFFLHHFQSVCLSTHLRKCFPCVLPELGAK